MDIYEDNMGEARIHAEFGSQNRLRRPKMYGFKI
jgi:hypothetical protein